MPKKAVLGAMIILSGMFAGLLQPVASPGGPWLAEAQAPTTPTPPTPGCPTAASGYPDIAGEWIEVSGFPSDGHSITITQSGATITAVGSYAIGDSNIAYTVDGALTRDGVITAQLVHTEGVLPSAEGFTQDRRMMLTPDCNRLDISAETVGGGGEHQLSWRRASPLIAPTETTAPRPTPEPLEPCQTPPGADSKARFSSISKEVEVFPESDPGAIFSAKPNTVLRVDDHVLTGEESHAVIIFADLSTLLMKEESEIIIGCPELRSKRVDYRRGTFWLKVKKLILGDAIEVKTNLATMGIRGTTLVTEVTDEATTLKVIEGNVEFTSLVTGETMMIGAGETVSATAEGLSEKGAFDVEAESALWPLEGGDGLPELVIVVGVIALVSLAGLIFVRKRRQTI